MNQTMQKPPRHTLDILVPHYHETSEEVRPLLDSIALQQSVDMDDIRVIICHDGQDIPFFGFTQYPYTIKEISIPHEGVSASRNAALDASLAEYVMFCDADDLFCSTCGLYLIWREMDRTYGGQPGFDTMVSRFLEETRDKDGHPVYISHDMDSTFVHGKVHRREYLIEKYIRWNPHLTIHEDSYFNILAQKLAPPERVIYCPTVFYLWKWRDSSVCRHDPKYILKTYRHMIDSNDMLIREFIRRGRQDLATVYVAHMVLDAYYSMNCQDWMDSGNSEYRQDTERHFARYFKRYHSLWDCCPPDVRMRTSQSVRSRSVNRGMMMESMTLDQWLHHIETFI